MTVKAKRSKRTNKLVGDQATGRKPLATLNSDNDTEPDDIEIPRVAQLTARGLGPLSQLMDDRDREILRRYVDHWLWDALSELRERLIEIEAQLAAARHADSRATRRRSSVRRSAA